MPSVVPTLCQILYSNLASTVNTCRHNNGTTTMRSSSIVRQIVRLETRLAPPQSLHGRSPHPRNRRASACFIIDGSTASARFADANRVTERSSNRLRTSFALITSTRRSPEAGSMSRFTAFQRSPQSARNTGATVRTAGTAQVHRWLRHRFTARHVGGPWTPTRRSQEGEPDDAKQQA